MDGTVDLARDRDLVERCQGGDRSAFEELYHRYHRRLFHFCLRRLHEPYEAEDAVQEAFAKAWRAMPRFGGERRFYPWLTVIAGNVCTDVLRRRCRLTPVEEVPLPTIDLTDGAADEALIEAVDVSMATQALGQLSERHQRVLQLREWSGWSTQRLAEHEGVAVPAMETLLWRARQALKREFAALADTSGRLGVVIGLGLAACRRFVGRTAARVTGRHPALQSLASSFRSPGAYLATLAVAGGAVGGAVLVTQPGAPAAVAVTMPSISAPAAPAFAAATRPTAAGGAAPTGGAGSSTSLGNAAGTGAPALTVAGGQVGGGSATSGTAGGAAPGGPAAVGSTATSATGAGGGTVTSVAGAVGSTLTSVAGGAGSTVTSLVGAVGGTVTSVVKGVGGTVTSVAGGAGSTVTSLVGAVGGTVTSVVKGVGGTVTSLVGGLAKPASVPGP